MGEHPLALLGQLANVELVDFAGQIECCGFGGTFSVKQSAISWAMVEDKCAAIRQSGAELLVSADAGCLMNIGGALQRQSADDPALPPAPAWKPLALFIKERVQGTNDGRK